MHLDSLVEFPICTGNRQQRSPAIWGNLVVWEDTRHGSSGDIHGRNLMSGRLMAVCRKPGIQAWPAIWDSTVVWTDGRDLIADWNIRGRKL